jgi:aldose 1-epimerase
MTPGRSVSVLGMRADALELAIAPEVGGSIAAFLSHDDGGARHWLRPAAPGSLRRRDPLGMSCFPMVPFCNRIRCGRFEFDGRAHVLAQSGAIEPHALHGAAWRRPWSVEAHDAASTRLCFCNDGEDWPSAYRAVQQFDLSAECLTVTLSVENRGREPMPLGMGLHPYLPRPAGTRLKTSLARMLEVDAELLPTGRALRPPLLRALADGADLDSLALDNTFSGWSRHAEVVWPDGRRLTIEADPPFELLAIFAPRGCDYFCLEPVSNAPDWINHTSRDATLGGTVLAPGETQTARCRFQPFQPRSQLN